MTSLMFNFVKRAIIIPILLLVIVVVCIYLVVPRMLNTANAAPSTETVEDADIVDLSYSYDTVEYDSFNKLGQGNYVGTIECANVGMSKIAIVYDDDQKNAVSTFTGSREPWKNGSIAIITNDISSDLSKIYNAEKGDEIKVDFFSNNEYTYTLEKKVIGKTEKDIKSYMNGTDLVICVPYNNFSDLSNSFYYTIYIARK